MSVFTSDILSFILEKSSLAGWYGPGGKGTVLLEKNKVKNTEKMAF